MPQTVTANLEAWYKTVDEDMDIKPVAVIAICILLSCSVVRAVLSTKQQQV
jgi:hypothetical protein